MAVREEQIGRSFDVAGTAGAALAAATAAVVARTIGPGPERDAVGPFAHVALVALALFAAVEVAAALARRRARPGPLARRRAGALARLAVAFAATLASPALRPFAGGERAACLAALCFVLLVVPASPMAAGRLLEAELARRMPQLVAARLGARIGVTAALAAPAALLLLQRVRADAPSLVALVATALLLLFGTGRARAAAFVRELRLQARRADAELAADLRAELLATPLDPDLAALRPLTAEQFRAFRGDCERRYGQRHQRPDGYA